MLFDFLWFGSQTAMGGSAPDDDDDEIPEPAAVADARSRGKIYIADLPADIEPARRLLQRYSGIPARDVDKHIQDISQREKLWAIHPSVSVGHYRFLSMQFTSDPRYKDALNRLLVADSDVAFLDVGCCVGQVLRQLAFDGVDSSRLYGMDSESRFLRVGYELFRDRDTLKATLVAGDVLASGEKDEGEDASRLLNGKMTIIHVMSFFHLFSWQAQVRAAMRMINFLKPDDADVMIFGRHVGTTDPPDVEGRQGRQRYLHNAETWQDLWDHVGELTGTRWRTEVEFIDKAGIEMGGADGTVRRMRFGVYKA
ncbi:hypothetical protein DL764_006198 [Monosporascus ibericus]|uniref:Methyltransferase domain-containing protein n=1 Tax=Monosporascus ibericus TaxID=155417 RepID=A0A4Q4T5J9_9PEZI|nr:hypothetical protein DL764_006198 [Monosporascus ibericus]